MTLQSHSDSARDTSTADKIPAIFRAGRICGGVGGAESAVKKTGADIGVDITTADISIKRTNEKIHDEGPSNHMVIRRATPLPQTRSKQSLGQDGLWEQYTLPAKHTQ